MISSVLPYAVIIDTMSELEFEEFTIDPESMALTAAKVTLPSFGESYQSGFWYQLEQLRNFLSPLKETTVTLSARKTPTAHLVVGETLILEKAIDKVEPLEDDCLVKSADKMTLKRIPATSVCDSTYIGSTCQNKICGHLTRCRVETFFQQHYTLQFREVV